MCARWSGTYIEGDVADVNADLPPKPYMDPLLRASRGLLKELIFALQEVGLIAYSTAGL